MHLLQPLMLVFTVVLDKDVSVNNLVSEEDKSTLTVARKYQIYFLPKICIIAVFVKSSSPLTATSLFKLLFCNYHCVITVV